MSQSPEILGIRSSFLWHSECPLDRHLVLGEVRYCMRQPIIGCMGAILRVGVEGRPSLQEVSSQTHETPLFAIGDVAAGFEGVGGVCHDELYVQSIFHLIHPDATCALSRPHYTKEGEKH
ncbi:hypothetical protein KIL84_004766 [Mauremys mutica]|uniref:Uncharacterized protein n=1 Tax=Mauremys mutica TaxID=74926 RepID=A0A9D3XMD0_9SAUR|nr:hypothetical protein KIL84_004766 [Mauremys mutica]